jgi:hypothetical protein
MRSSTITSPAAGAAAVSSPTDPGQVRRSSGETRPVTVRIISWQKDGRDHAHARLANEIYATVEGLRGAALIIEPIPVYGDEDRVLQEVRVAADVVVICCHSWWDRYGEPDEEWLGLLGVDRSRLAGAVTANAVIFVACKLHALPELSELVARRTPTVACEVETKLRGGHSPLIVGALLKALLGPGRPAAWEAALDEALTAARAEAKKKHPRSGHWDRWRIQVLSPGGTRATS